MAVETFLRRLVVVWADAEHAINTTEVGVVELLNECSRVVAATSHEDGNLRSHLIDYELLDLVLLLGREAGCLACRGKDAEEVSAIGKLIVNETIEGLIVNGAIGMERCNEGNTQSSEDICCHTCCYFLQRYE